MLKPRTAPQPAGSENLPLNVSSLKLCSETRVRIQVHNTQLTNKKRTGFISNVVRLRGLEKIGIRMGGFSWQAPK